jgi:hypothetical protein
MIDYVRGHHTKDKGDIGVAHAIADLADQGFLVLMPFCEHAPFDLVAYRDGLFLRVQVKYRTRSRGILNVKFASYWSDSKGLHTRALEKDDIDVVCVYDPTGRRCYYVDPKQFGGSISLRVEPTRNGQQRNVLSADAFTKVPANLLAPTD